MDGATLAAVMAVVTVTGVAVWRFTRVEAELKHQNKCQTTLVKAVSRLNANQKILSNDLKEIKSMLLTGN